MYQIVQEVTSQIEVEKSRFIGMAFPLKEKEEVGQILKDLQKQHPKARHICYAMIYDDVSRSNDDGEPSGTAGRPLLEVLKKNELNHILLVVIRYFGGVLLGAGRLLRTYVEAGKKAIEQAQWLQEKEMIYYEVALSYEQLERFETLLRKEKSYVAFRDYEEKVNIGFSVENSLDEKFSECFRGETITQKKEIRTMLLPVERRNI